eukprot:EG_transcript_19477
MLAVDVADAKQPGRSGAQRGLGCAAVLCSSAAVLMVVATAVPNWSASDVSTAGPWGKCILRPVMEDWYCRSMDLCERGAFLPACRTFTVLACLSSGLAACAVAAAVAGRPRQLRVSRRTLVGGLALSFGCSCLSWGMWLGVAGQCFIPHDLAPKLGVAFALACAASGLTLCAVPLVLWGYDPAAGTGHQRLAGDGQQLEVTVSGVDVGELSPPGGPLTLTLPAPLPPTA